MYLSNKSIKWKCAVATQELNSNPAHFPVSEMNMKCCRKWKEEVLDAYSIIFSRLSVSGKKYPRLMIIYITYPRTTLVTESAKFSWKQDLKPNSYHIHKKYVISNAFCKETKTHGYMDTAYQEILACSFIFITTS